MTIQIIRQNFRLTGTLPSSVSSTCGNIGNTTDISNDNDKQNWNRNNNDIYTKTAIANDNGKGDGNKEDN